jgi:predicted MPP superfamily phosphohydrolase
MRVLRMLRTAWGRITHLAGPRVRRRTGVVVVALVGAWFGLLVGGQVTAPIGPVNANLSIRPSLTGNTFVDVAPLGSIELDTTDSPLALNASVAEIRVTAVQEIFRDPDSLEHLQAQVIADLRTAVLKLAIKSLGCGILGAALFTAVVFRRWRTTWKGALVAFGLMLVAYALAAATWNPKAIEQPRYTGLLTSAPSVVGTAESLTTHFGKYSAELAKLVTNVTRLYDTTSTLPLYSPDPNTLRVLHVSDIHLNPAAWDVMRSVQQQFHAQMIIDTGDLTDHGSAPEDQVANEIGTFKVPYVYIKGNHDSESTVRAVTKQKNAVVLNGRERTVDSLRLWGIGDPRFTPDKNTHEDEGDAQLVAYGQQLRSRIEAAGTVDIAMTHDPTIAGQWDGLAPLVLAGHTHRRETRMLPGGTRLMVEGSTGGAGLRALDHGTPTPIELDVMYFDKQTRRLQAWDEITLGGLGLTSARIDRHVESEPNRPLNQVAGESPSPALSPTPTGTETPYTLPPSTPPPTPNTSTSKRAGRRRRTRGSALPDPLPAPYP